MVKSRLQICKSPVVSINEIWTTTVLKSAILFLNKSLQIFFWLCPIFICACNLITMDKQTDGHGTLTCPTKAEKALVLSLPAAGLWNILTHSLSRYSVFSWSPGGSSNSRACDIPECIIEVGPPGARSSNPPSFLERIVSIRVTRLEYINV